MHDLRATASKPGQIVLTWRLVHPADIASVFVRRGSSARCPTAPVPLAGRIAGTRIGTVAPRSREVDATERDTKHYCYAVFTLDKAGNWASPVIDRAVNPGDTTPPTAVTDVTSTTSSSGVRLTWKNPADAAEILVIRGAGAACPSTPAAGTRVGDRSARSSENDTTVDTATAHCYSVFALDQAGNRSPAMTTNVAPFVPPRSGTRPALSGGQPGSSGSSLTNVVGIVGGGAIVLAALAYATLRIARREWEWHTRTGYGIRDLMSIDVRDYSPLALVIPAAIGVCIAGAVVVLLLSL